MNPHNANGGMQPQPSAYQYQNPAYSQGQAQGPNGGNGYGGPYAPPPGHGYDPYAYQQQHPPYPMQPGPNSMNNQTILTPPQTQNQAPPAPQSPNQSQQGFPPQGYGMAPSRPPPQAQGFGGQGGGNPPPQLMHQGSIGGGGGGGGGGMSLGGIGNMFGRLALTEQRVQEIVDMNLRSGDYVRRCDLAAAIQYELDVQSKARSGRFGGGNTQAAGSQNNPNANRGCMAGCKSLVKLWLVACVATCGASYGWLLGGCCFRETAGRAGDAADMAGGAGVPGVSGF